MSSSRTGKLNSSFLLLGSHRVSSFLLPDNVTNREPTAFMPPIVTSVGGSNGTVRVGWKESKFRQATSPDWVVFGSGYDKIGAMRAQVENFCRALRGQEPLLITVEDAIASVAVVEQAYRSLNESRWVRVRDGDNARSPSGLPQQTAV